MFDKSAARTRLARLWSLDAQFGVERSANRVYLDHFVRDRFQLVHGLQVLRDELHLSSSVIKDDRSSLGADFSQPSVVTTQAFTNCGDRIHQGEIRYYEQVVAARFATLSEIGLLKPEAFHPTGGGTDDGATLAHVTWAHAMDHKLRARIYDGNASSFVLCAFDLKTHCGRLDAPEGIAYGRTQESPWREPRAACGAVVGALTSFDANNAVHRRIRRDLGEENFLFLSQEGVLSEEGTAIEALVAAAIVAIRGMLDTAHAIAKEMDERGLAHLTASVTINRPAMTDTVVYLARATVFDGEMSVQGFGTDAKAYLGQFCEIRSEPRIALSYAGADRNSRLPIERHSYQLCDAPPPSDPFV